MPVEWHREANFQEGTEDGVLDDVMTLFQARHHVLVSRWNKGVGLICNLNAVCATIGMGGAIACDTLVDSALELLRRE